VIGAKGTTSGVHFPRRVSHIVVADDVIPLKNARRFVAGVLHRRLFGDACVHIISYSTSPQIVRNPTRVPGNRCRRFSILDAQIEGTEKRIASSRGRLAAAIQRGAAILPMRSQLAVRTEKRHENQKRPETQ